MTRVRLELRLIRSDFLGDVAHNPLEDLYVIAVLGNLRQKEWETVRYLAHTTSGEGGREEGRKRGRTFGDGDMADSIRRSPTGAR